MEKSAAPTGAGRTEALPSFALAVARAGGSRSAEAERLAAADPALAARLLRIANSPLYRRGAAVASVDHAVRVLGAAVVRRVASGLGPPPRAAEGGFDRAKSLAHAVAASAACRVLARRLGVVSPEEAYAAGLLQSLGQWVFDSGEPRRYAEVHRRAAADGRTLAEAEREVFGLDHSRAGFALAEHWNLPPALRDCIGLHHAGADLEGATPGAASLVEIVAAADAILASAGIAGCCRNGRETPSVGGRALSGEDVAAALDAGRAALRETAALFGLPPSAEADFEGAVRTAASASAAATLVAPGRTGLAGLPEAASVLMEALRAIRSLPSPEEAWEAGLKAVRDALGVDRSFLYTYDAERGKLELLRGVDESQIHRAGEPGAAATEVSLAPGGALSHALGDGRAALLDDLGADHAFLAALGVPRAAAAAVDVKDRTYGVLVVDNIFSGTPIGETDGALLSLFAAEIGLAVENILLKKESAKLRSLAERDELTGVNNRRNLMAMFQKELDRARRYGSTLSVAMVDIDHFKSFNDTYGHQAGDDVLRTIAQVLVASSREIDVVGRYGGEEFMILLPETTLPQAIVYSERLRARVEARGLDLRSRFNRTGPLTISVGVTDAHPEKGDSIELLVGRVDGALYDAKEQGRNRVVPVDGAAPA